MTSKISASRISSRSCLLLLALAVPISALAWSGGGHKVVALIAFSQLPPELRTKVVNTLKDHPRWKKDFEAEMPAEIVAGTETERQRWLFAQAAIWPDMARDLPDFH